MSKTRYCTVEGVRYRLKLDEPNMTTCENCAGSVGGHGLGHLCLALGDCGDGDYIWVKASKQPKPKVLTGYKVMFIGSGKAEAKLGPTSVTRHTDSGGVTYLKNKWVEPVKGCGPLCVFEDLACAVDWGHCMCGHIVVCKCKYKPSSYHKIWSEAGVKTMSGLPAGTKLAKAVKLIGRLTCIRKR